jgi:hypothetical protein
MPSAQLLGPIAISSFDTFFLIFTIFPSLHTQIIINYVCFTCHNSYSIARSQMAQVCNLLRERSLCGVRRIRTPASRHLVESHFEPSKSFDRAAHRHQRTNNFRRGPDARRSFPPYEVRDPSLFGVLFVATALTAVNDICLEGSHPSFEGYLLTTDTHSFKIDWFISWKEKDECYEQQ